MALWVAGCGKPSNAPEPAKTVDAARFFNGRWYEVARTPMKLTRRCVAATTDFSHRADGRLMERDACRMGGPDGAEKAWGGPVTLVNPPADSKIKVYYIVLRLFPVPRFWWVLDHGDDYSWFIVSDPSMRVVGVFTRAARPGAAEVAALTARARALGVDVGRLEFPALARGGS